VAAVCSDNVVLLGKGVFDADGDGFLTGGEMAEPADLLLFVKSVGSHFHTAGRAISFLCLVEVKWGPTEWKPYHSTFASAPSSSSPWCRMGDPARMSRRTRLRGVPGMVDRLPVFHHGQQLFLLHSLQTQ